MLGSTGGSNEGYETGTGINSVGELPGWRRVGDRACKAVYFGRLQPTSPVTDPMPLEESPGPGRRMRVLIVSQYFWPESFRINDLATALVERGHEVTVLTSQPNYPGGRFFAGHGYFRPYTQWFGEVLVKRVPMIPRGDGTKMRLIVNYLSFAASASMAGPLVIRSKPDVIFVFQVSPITMTIPAMVLRAQKKVPIVLWVLDLWPESLVGAGALAPGAQALKLGRMLTRWIYGHCDRILGTSRSFLPAIQQDGVPDEKVGYLPNWGEGLYEPVELPPDAPEHGMVPPGFRVMIAGQISGTQAPETLLSAALALVEYPAIHWVVVGGGRRKAWLEAEVTRCGLSGNFHFLGSRPAEEMPRLIAIADVCVVTLRRSPAFALTVPGRVQTYLACGKPIVASMDGEGARIIEESGAGIAVPAEDAQGLSEAVLRLFQAPASRRLEMGRLGRQYFEANFTRDKVMDSLEAVMTEVVASSQGVG